MDAIVQLVRNALCCIKDLTLLGDTFLYDPTVTAKFITFPEPLDQTTPLEILICICQFYAFVSVTFSGYRLMFSNGLVKARRVEALVTKRSSLKNKSIADQLVDERLMIELEEANKSSFIGVNVFAIGVCFLWLSANSLHITQAGWIGGLPALIHALTVMEMALAPLLYFMIVDGIELIGKSARMKYLAGILRKCDTKLPQEVLTNETVDVLFEDGWAPFWSNGISAPPKDSTVEEKQLEGEISTLLTNLESWITDKDNDKMKTTITQTADRLEADSTSARYEAYREFVYFVLNFIAFYGYMLGVLTYYTSDDENEYSVVRTLKLGMSHSDADWHGNFAGDLMWTIEPVVIMGSPLLFKWMKPLKSDGGKKVKKE